MDDIALPFFAQRQIVFSVWVDFGEQKWITLAERRGSNTLKSPFERTELRTGHAQIPCPIAYKTTRVERVASSASRRAHRTASDTSTTCSEASQQTTTILHILSLRILPPVRYPPFLRCACKVAYASRFSRQTVLHIDDAPIQHYRSSIAYCLMVLYGDSYLPFDYGAVERRFPEAGSSATRLQRFCDTNAYRSPPPCVPPH